jgi:hypothetical protein
VWYKLGLVGAQEVGRDQGSTITVEDFFFFHGKEMQIINWEQDFCIPENSVSS